MHTWRSWIYVASIVGMSPLVTGHGRLIEPPSRASAWRFGFDTPHNYNDHELYCGGFTRQWNKNGGKCGVCGDAWDQPTPRPHELGGRFGQGIIVRRYPEGGDIDVKVELTASHNGYFEFRICDDPDDTTQECLDTHVLTMAGRNGDYKFYPRDGNKVYQMKYHLPDDLKCEHCVFQWRYIAGNNWGNCENGTGAVGCGPQEEFRACADISIGDEYSVSTRRPRPPYVPPSRRPIKPTGVEPINEHTSWLGGLIAAVTLIFVVIVLAVVYLYYYRGHRIKAFLKPRSAVPQVPTRPPRQKRHSICTADSFTDSNHGYMIEAGFENVNLKK